MTLRREFLSVAAAVAAALLLSAGAVRAAEDGEPDPGKAPAPAAAAEQVANGLQVALVMKDRTFTFGDNTVTRKTLVMEIKNVGDKPLVLGFTLGGGRFGGMAADSPVKFSAKDAAGKDVPRDAGRGGREPQAKPEDRPVVLTVIKPGKTMEQDAAGFLNFPAEGKYTVWVEIDEKERDEVLPGVKPWAGKVKSNVLEYEFRGRGQRGGGGQRPGGQRPAGQQRPGGGEAQQPAPPPGGAEAF